MAAEPWVGIKFAPISVAAVQTDDVLVAGVAGKRIRVISYSFTVGGAAAVTILFESGTTTALTGTLDVPATAVDRLLTYEGGVYAPAFETLIGEDLVVTNTGAGGTLEGHLTYQEV